MKHHPCDRRLFIESSHLTLKSVLRQNGNPLPSTIVGHSVYMKETYANMTTLLKSTKHTEHT